MYYEKAKIFLFSAIQQKFSVNYNLAKIQKGIAFHRTIYGKDTRKLIFICFYSDTIAHESLKSKCCCPEDTFLLAIKSILYYSWLNERKQAYKKFITLAI